MKQSVCTLYLLALLPLVSCAQKERDGGSCSYETTYYPAPIILIYPINETSSEVVVTTTLYGQTDTLHFSHEGHEYFSNTELTENNYMVGDTLTYKIMEITDGSCSPYIKVLTKERFKPKR